MSKNKSLLLGFSIGAFALVLIAASILGIVFSTNTQGVRAVESSIFRIDSSVDAIIDTSCDYGEAYPTTTFYAILSETATGNIVEVTECDFSTRTTDTSAAATLTPGTQYTVNIIGPTFLNIRSTISGTSGGASGNVDSIPAKTFSFTYSTGMLITFNVIQILDDSWFTEFN